MSEKTVMIVDDVPFVRKTLADIFNKNGFSVVAECSTAAEAIHKYKELEPDLTTMDIVMPGKSGLEATREIITFNKEAIVVIVSAMEQENLLMEAISAGARDYIVKPFKESEILKTVNKIFEKT